MEKVKEDSSKSAQSRKNIRIIVIGGVFVLSLFIVVRLVVRAQDDGQLKPITALNYKEVKLPEDKTKEERWEEEEGKKFNEEMSGDKYVGSNFKDILKKTGEPKKVIEEEKVYTQEPVFKQQTKNYTAQSNDEKDFNEVIEKINKNKKKDEPVVDQVHIPVKNTTVSNDDLFGTNKQSSGNTASNRSGSNFKAQAYGKQNISDGGGVIIRLMEPMVVNGVSLPKNTLLYGKGQYSGNRVRITLNKAKTPGGEIPIRIKVYDNDKIEGIAYKAPIDEVVEKKQDETEINLGTQYDGIINKGVKSVVNGTKDLIQKSRTLKLDDGYIVFLEPIDSNN